MEVFQYYSFDEIGIQSQVDLKFESACKQILI